MTMPKAVYERDCRKREIRRVDQWNMRTHISIDLRTDEGKRREWKQRTDVGQEKSSRCLSVLMEAAAGRDSRHLDRGLAPHVPDLSSGRASTECRWNPRIPQGENVRLSIRPASVFNPLKLSRATHTARSRKPTIPFLCSFDRLRQPPAGFPRSSTATLLLHHAFYFFPFASFEFPGFSLNPADRPM